MYIRNINGDVGMATLLQNNKNIVSVGVGNSILVGNVMNAGTTSLVTANVINNGTTTPNLLTSINPGPTIANFNSTLMLPAQPQTFFITNSKSDTSSGLLTYDQTQHQPTQQQQTQQRILIAPNTVSLPIGSILSNGGGGAGISTVASTSSGSFLVTTSNVNTINGFQQQFQQQVNNNLQLVQQQQPPQQHRQQKLVINNGTTKLIFNQNPNSFTSTTSTQGLTAGGSVYKKAPVLQQVVSNVNGSSSSEPPPHLMVNMVKPVKKANPPSRSSQAKSSEQKHNLQTLQYTSTAIKHIKHRAIVLNGTKASGKILATITKAPTKATADTGTKPTAARQVVNLAAVSTASTGCILPAGTVADNPQTPNEKQLIIKSSHTTESSSLRSNKLTTTTTINNAANTVNNNTRNNNNNNKIINNKNGSIVNNSFVGALTNRKSVAVVPPSVWSLTKSSTINTPSSSAVAFSGDVDANATRIVDSITNPVTVANRGSSSSSSSIPSSSSSSSSIGPSSCKPLPEAEGIQSLPEKDDAAPAAIAQDAKETETETEAEPEVDILINNVVCAFSLRCHLNLREIALRGTNVEYRRENGMVTMKLRKPYTTASIWSSGRITCTGATSEQQSKIAARRFARCIQKLGFNVKFSKFRIVNVLGTCSMPWAINIVKFSTKYKREASYEPELHPGVTFKMRHPKATLKIFSTGSITITAANVANVQAAVEIIYPLVYEFRKNRSPEEKELLRLKQLNNANGANSRKEAVSSPSVKKMGKENSAKSQTTSRMLGNDKPDGEMDVDDSASDLIIDEDIVVYDPIDQTENPYDADEYDDMDVFDKGLTVGVAVDDTTDKDVLF